MALFVMLIKFTYQQCTDFQYDDGGTCKDCVPPCLKCTDETTCTEWAHSEMILSGGSKSILNIII